MFNLSALTSVLDSLDSAAKETLEEPKVSATTLRSRRKVETSSSSVLSQNNLDQLEYNSSTDKQVTDLIRLILSQCLTSNRLCVMFAYIGRQWQ